MKKKILILFTLISSLALSDSRDLKMKMVLNREDVNQILIDIVPEDFETVKTEELKKDISKPKEIKKVIQKKNIVKKKAISKSIVGKKELKSEEIKPKEELKVEENKKEINPVNTPIKEEPKFEEKKSNKSKLIIGSIIGALALVFIKFIKKSKGGK